MMLECLVEGVETFTSLLIESSSPSANIGKLVVVLILDHYFPIPIPSPTIITAKTCRVNERSWSPGKSRPERPKAGATMTRIRKAPALQGNDQGASHLPACLSYTSTKPEIFFACVLGSGVPIPCFTSFQHNSTEGRVCVVTAASIRKTAREGPDNRRSTASATSTSNHIQRATAAYRCECDSNKQRPDDLIAGKSSALLKGGIAFQQASGLLPAAATRLPLHRRRSAARSPRADTHHLGTFVCLA